MIPIQEQNYDFFDSPSNDISRCAAENLVINSITQPYMNTLFHQQQPTMSFQHLPNGNSKRENEHDTTSDFNTLPNSFHNILPPCIKTLDEEQMEVDGSSNQKDTNEFIEKESSPSQGLIKYEVKDCKKPVPIAWVDLYHSRPLSGDTRYQQEWLQKVKIIAGLTTPKNPVFQHSNNDTITPECYFFGSEMINKTTTSFESTIQETRNEFTGAVPPRVVSVSMNESNKEALKFRQHADHLSLQVNTDLDIVGSNSMTILDSDGSFKVFTSTPKSLEHSYDV